jgi:hypothetical protein
MENTAQGESAADSSANFPADDPEEIARCFSELQKSLVAWDEDKWEEARSSGELSDLISKAIKTQDWQPRLKECLSGSEGNDEASERFDEICKVMHCHFFGAFFISEESAIQSMSEAV